MDSAQQGIHEPPFLFRIVLIGKGRRRPRRVRVRPVRCGGSVPPGADDGVDRCGGVKYISSGRKDVAPVLGDGWGCGYAVREGRAGGGGV